MRKPASKQISKNKKNKKTMRMDSPTKYQSKEKEENDNNEQQQSVLTNPYPYTQPNEERYYCKNANLLHEMLKWKNSTKLGFKVYKMTRDKKLVLTETTEDDYKHEKYKQGTKYFIKYTTKDERYGQVKASPKKYGEISVHGRYVTEDVTMKVKGVGYAFDIDDDENHRTFSEVFGNMLITIGRKVSNHSFFRNYSNELKEDMRAYGYEKVIKGLYNYNFKYENAFSYITQAFFNSFKSILSKHYKQLNIKRDLTKKAMVDLQSQVPGSSMEKCLRNQFKGNDFDDFSDF